MTKVYHIVEKRKIYFTISLCIIGISFLKGVIAGVKVDRNFKGGTMVEYSYTGDIGADQIQSVASGIIGQDITIKKGENFADKSTYFQLSFTSKNGLPAETQETLTKTLKSTYPENNISLLTSNDVKAAVGREFFEKCLVAVAFSFLVLIIYIAVRFKRISGWSAGVMAIVAL